MTAQPADTTCYKHKHCLSKLVQTASNNMAHWHGVVSYLNHHYVARLLPGCIQAYDVLMLQPNMQPNLHVAQYVE
jgi:hypothetical protein